MRYVCVIVINNPPATLRSEDRTVSIARVDDDAECAGAIHALRSADGAVHVHTDAQRFQSEKFARPRF